YGPQSFRSSEALKTPKKPKAGRPKLPKGSARGEMLRIRVTAEELKTIEANARASGKTRSEFIREKLLGVPEA
ncbi:MAG TPA: ribbon-helix-helix protein, CopG family, partial [Terracidiphilus sp.]|nr:ribbon-helix-helix protein, CopG family [Terracidiphilus sp.]